MTIAESIQLNKEQIASAFGVPAHMLADPDRTAVPRYWSLCMTSENHGTVGKAGDPFRHAPGKHERVLVVEVPAGAGAPVDQVNLQLVTSANGQADVDRALRAAQVWANEEYMCGRRMGKGEPGIHDRADAAKTECIAAILALAAPVAAPAGQVVVPFDFHAHLARQATWSEKTFGPGARTKGVSDHIRKELLEIEADPLDLREWIDVVILALDGAWRCGGTPEQIIAGIVAKQAKNEGRTWPDWRTADPDKAIEHDRSFDAAMQASTSGERQEGGA
jgi:hypothetical protein